MAGTARAAAHIDNLPEVVDVVGRREVQPAVGSISVFRSVVPEPLFRKARPPPVNLLAHDC